MIQDHQPGGKIGENFSRVLMEDQGVELWNEADLAEKRRRLISCITLRRYPHHSKLL